MGVVYEDDPIFRAVMRAGQIRLPDLIVRVKLDPQTFTAQLATLAKEKALVVSLSDPDTTTRKLLDRLAEIAQAEETEGTSDWRRRFLKRVDADPVLRDAAVHLSPRELRRFATA